MVLEAKLNLTTTSTQSLTGADQASFVRQLVIDDNVGERVKLTGFELRQFANMENCALADPAAFATSTQTTDATFRHVIPWKFPLSRREHDTSLPIDDIAQGGKIDLFMPAASDLLVSGSTPVINSGAYQFVFYCREEFNVELKARNHVFSQPSTGNDAYINIPVNGDMLRFLLMTKQEAGPSHAFLTGGVTDVSIDNLIGYNKIPREFLKDEYALSRVLRPRGMSAAGDPIAAGDALPIISVGRDTKFPDLLRWSGNMILRLTSTVTTPVFIVHTITPRSARIAAATNQSNRLAGDHKYQTKLQNGQKDTPLRTPSEWGATGGYIPAKAAGVVLGDK